MTQDEQDEADFRAYQEQEDAARAREAERHRRAADVAAVESDVATLRDLFPALAPGAALAKLRDNFRDATDPKEKWAIYARLRDMESRARALRARHANGTNVPNIGAAIAAERATLEP